MMTSREQKLAAFEASERLRRHAWLAAILGIGLATATLTTGTPWLGGAATIALLAAAVSGFQARQTLSPRPRGAVRSSSRDEGDQR
jgi:hypothetical protein